MTNEGKVAVADCMGIWFDGSVKLKFTLTQTGLIEKILKTTGMEDCNGNEHSPASQTPIGTDRDSVSFDEQWDYASVIGMLLYLSSNSRYDISGLELELRYKSIPITLA